MASAVYPLALQAFLTGDIDMAADDIKCCMVDTADTPYAATDQFLSDLAAAGIVATSGNLTGKTTVAGVFDAADTPIAAVTGDPVETVIVYQDTGVAATSRLLSYNEVSFTADGSDCVVTWSASGIFGI